MSKPSSIKFVRHPHPSPMPADKRADFERRMRGDLPGTLNAAVRQVKETLAKEPKEIATPSMALPSELRVAIAAVSGLAGRRDGRTVAVRFALFALRVARLVFEVRLPLFFAGIGGSFLLVADGGGGPARARSRARARERQGVRNAARSRSAAEPRAEGGEQGRRP